MAGEDLLGAAGSFCACRVGNSSTMASPQYSIQTSLRGHDKAVRAGMLVPKM